MVHWYLDRVGASRQQSKSLGRSHWARARAPSPRPFSPHSGTPPDRAAAAQGHFSHTPSVRRWSGASTQRGGRFVARSAVAAWRNRHVVLGVSCAAWERRWKAPRPEFCALSASLSRRRGRPTLSEFGAKRSGRLLTRARKRLWLSGLGGTAAEPSSPRVSVTRWEKEPSPVIHSRTALCNYYPAFVAVTTTSPM